ncbi:hypothetical protein CCYA_CCYA04G1191 [Cyanidiococcus yangmingshanensis]|nr:hypothetical protein CCYA_CCYA04G1191 [Cyanidiococcus yangmingshanensis]
MEEDGVGSLSATEQLVYSGYGILRSFRDPPGLRSPQERYAAWSAYADLVEQVSLQSDALRWLVPEPHEASTEEAARAWLPALSGVWLLGQLLLFTDIEGIGPDQMDWCLQQWFARICPDMFRNVETLFRESDVSPNWEEVARRCAFGQRHVALQILNRFRESPRRLHQQSTQDTLNQEKILELVCAALEEAPSSTAEPNWSEWQEACAAAADALTQAQSDWNTSSDVREAHRLLVCLSGAEEFPREIVQNWAGDLLAQMLYRTDRHLGDALPQSSAYRAATSASQRFPLSCPIPGDEFCFDGAVEATNLLCWVSQGIAMGIVDEAVAALTLLPFGLWHAAHMADVVEGVHFANVIARTLFRRYADLIAVHPSIGDQWRIVLRYRMAYPAPDAAKDTFFALIPATYHTLREQRLLESEAMYVKQRTAAAVDQEALQKAFHHRRAQFIEAIPIPVVAFYEWTLLGRQQHAFHNLVAHMQQIEKCDFGDSTSESLCFAQLQSLVEAFEAAAQPHTTSALSSRQRNQILVMLDFLPDYIRLYRTVLRWAAGASPESDEIQELLRRVSRILRTLSFPMQFRRSMLMLTLERILPQCTAQGLTLTPDDVYPLIDTALWLSTCSSEDRFGTESSTLPPKTPPMEIPERHELRTERLECITRADLFAALARWKPLWIRAFSA